MDSMNMEEDMKEAFFNEEGFRQNILCIKLKNFDVIYRANKLSICHISKTGEKKGFIANYSAPMKITDFMQFGIYRLGRVYKFQTYDFKCFVLVSRCWWEKVWNIMYSLNMQKVDGLFFWGETVKSFSTVDSVILDWKQYSRGAHSNSRKWELYQTFSWKLIHVSQGITSDNVLWAVIVMA